MDTYETNKEQNTNSLLVTNEHYYRYVFKKTEKIVCSVLYILSKGQIIQGHKVHISDTIEVRAEEALNAVLLTLTKEAHEADVEIKAVLGSLITFKSIIEVGRYSGVLRRDLSDLLVMEIDGVLKSLEQYIHATDISQLFGLETSMSPKSAGIREYASTHATSPSTQPRVQRTNKDRRSAIVEILKEKGEVSIKDISDNIKDCSEKTIQRELNAMIKDSIILREGERRWSRYSLLK